MGWACPFPADAAHGKPVEFTDIPETSVRLECRGTYALGRERGKIPSIREGAPDLARLLELMPAAAFDDPDALCLVQDYLSLSISASKPSKS